MNQEKNAEVNIGYGCNNRCLFCVSGDAAGLDTRFAEPEKIKKELDTSYENGCRILGFLGGEPTIYPYITDVSRYAKKIGYKRITLTTNGTRLSDKNFCKELLDAGVGRFSISIHSHKASVEDLLTGVPGNFAKKIKAIKNLISLQKTGRVPYGIALNAVIHKKNYRHLKEFCVYFKKLGIGDIRFNFIRVEGRAKEGASLVPDMALAAKEAERVVLWNEKYGHLEITFGEVPLCFLGSLYLRDKNIFARYIGEFRDIPTEVSLLSGADRKRFNMRKKMRGDHRRFNLQEKRAERTKTKLPQCEECLLDSICEGVYNDHLPTRGNKKFIKPIKDEKNTRI
jgi:cyclic pyranopterin phosphate synthase